MYYYYSLFILPPLTLLSIPLLLPHYHYHYRYTAVDVLDANCPYAVSPDVNIANANGKLRGADKDNLKDPSTPHTSSVMYFCVLSSVIDPLLPPV